MPPDLNRLSSLTHVVVRRMNRKTCGRKPEIFNGFFFNRFSFFFLGCHKINIFHYFEVLWRFRYHSDANEASKRFSLVRSHRLISRWKVKHASLSTMMPSIKREFIVFKDNVWHVEASFRRNSFTHFLLIDVDAS